MAISTFSNPLPSLIDGLLQGHQLGLSIRNAQQQRQQFATQQALDNQKLTAQQLMNQNLELQNRQSLQQNARPVNSGMVTLEAGADIPSDVPGMPATPGAPAYVRKADPSRLLKTSDGQQWELKTPEEQQQSALNSQMSGMDQLEAAKAKAQVNAQGVARKYQLLQENGGTPAPAGLENLGIPQGSMLTRAELQAAGEASAGLRKANTITTRPGENIYDTSPQAGAASQPGAPQQGGVPMDAIATGPAAPPVGMNAGLPPNLQPKTSPLPGGPPAATPAGGASAPPLPNNPTANRMRLIASGGPANPTGDYAQFKGSFLPGYYQQHGITDPQPKDETAAYQAFLQEKKQKQQPEWAANETELAQRAAGGDANAEAALKRLDQSRLASRPINNTTITMPGLGAGTESAKNPGLMGEDFMATLPAGTAAQVRAIANGSAAMPSASSRSQGAMELRNAVFRYDPSYTDQRAQVRKAFTTGADGRNIGNLNTATVHLDQMAEAAKAMNNGTWQPGNQLYNYIRTKFGDAAPTNYSAVMNAFAGEAASALKGTATDPEIAHVMSTLQQNMSPQQAAGVAQTNLHVLGAKLNTYHERYQQQIPGDTAYSPVLPAARAIFQKYGMSDTGSTPTPQQGGGGRGGVGGGSFSMTATGPNGHRIGSNDGKTWFDASTGQRIQ